MEVCANSLCRNNPPSFTMTGGIAGRQVTLCGEWVCSLLSALVHCNSFTSLEPILTPSGSFIICCLYFLFKYDLDNSRSTTNPKFDLTGVRTHDLQIMDRTFHVSEMLVFTLLDISPPCMIQITQIVL